MPIEYLHYLLVTVLNIAVSIAVFEICLNLQNKITSLLWVAVTRKLLVLVFGALLFFLYKSVMYFLPEAPIDAKQYIGITYSFVMLFYLFKYFFPRQKYFNHETGEWQVGYKMKEENDKM